MLLSNSLPTSVPFVVPNLLPQPHTILKNANSVLPAPVVSIPSGFTNQGQNVQFVAIPAEHMSASNYSDFRRGAGFHRGFGGDGSLRGRGTRGRGNFARSQDENDAYSMGVAPFNIFENHIIPVGLHNPSKSFRPNLTTAKVFSLGTKFIPVWKKMNVKNLLLNSKIFEEACQTKFILLKLHLVHL